MNYTGWQTGRQPMQLTQVRRDVVVLCRTGHEPCGGVVRRLLADERCRGSGQHQQSASVTTELSSLRRGRVWPLMTGTQQRSSSRGRVGTKPAPSQLGLNVSQTDSKTLNSRWLHQSCYHLFQFHIVKYIKQRALDGSSGRTILLILDAEILQVPEM